MKTETKRDLLERNIALRLENDALTHALNDAVNGRVKWFICATESGNEYSIGISRPSGACGGIVTLVQCGMISAHFWEKFYRETHAHFSAIVTGEDTEENRAILARRALLDEAQAYVASCQRAA